MFTDSGACECKTNADCDDGNACNGIETCNSSQKCVNGQAVVCDATNDTACSANTCNSATGSCSMQNKNEGGGCDDKDNCTTSDQCTQGQCKGTTVPGCGATPTTAFCELTGTTGTKGTCKIRLAAATQSTDLAAGLQFKIEYDSSKVSLDGFACDHPQFVNINACEVLGQVGQGHTLSFQPAKTGWSGVVAVAIYHTGDAGKPITTS